MIMLMFTVQSGTAGRKIVQMKGRLDASSAAYMGTLLKQAVDAGITDLTLDFSRVLDFDYTAIELLGAILDFCGRDLSEITCCGLPDNITDLLKVFLVHGISDLKAVPYANMWQSAVCSHYLM